MSKRKSLTGTELLALNKESDAQTEAYWNGNYLNESVNLFSDEFSSESDISGSDMEDIADVQVWRRVDSEQPPVGAGSVPRTAV